MTAFLTAGSGFTQDSVPKADKPIVLVDGATIETVQGEQTFRMIRPRLVPQEKPAGPDVQFPTVLRDGDRWMLYGCVPGGPRPGTSKRSAVLHATSNDGVTWETETEDALEMPAEVESGFTPLVDSRPNVSKGQRFKALARAAGGGLLALASGDGKSWSPVADGPVLTSDAEDAFYGRNSAFWSEADGTYVAFVSELRDGKRGISRSASTDFRSWTRPTPLDLNDEGEDIWSATVFPVPTSPPLLPAMLTRTAAGKTGPADICLATSRDGGRIFERRFLEAWVRPEAGAETWRAMVPSPAVGFVRPEPWFGIDEMVFYAGGRRYELFANRFIACTVPAFEAGPPDGDPKAPNPTTITTKPFVVAGNTLELNASCDSTGGIKTELLDEQGEPIPGYTRADFLNSLGYAGSGYFWITVNRKKQPAELERIKQSFMGELYSDGQKLRAAWRPVQRGDAGAGNRVQWYTDWDISALKGRTVRLRILAHGADVFSFVTVDRPPQEGKVIELP